VAADGLEPQVTPAGSVADELERGDGAALAATSSAASTAPVSDDENVGAERSGKEVNTSCATSAASDLFIFVTCIDHYPLSLAECT